MRIMSFAMTVEALLGGYKDVTRRLGWLHLKPGDRVRAVRKAMGLRLGEKVEQLAIIRIVSVSRERLDTITPAEVAREGWPGHAPSEFVELFQSAYRCAPDVEVTRIEFVVEERGGARG